MVAHTPSDVRGAHTLVSAAGVSELNPGEVLDLLADLRELAGQEAALALRLGMVLACIKQFDLAEIGWSGFLSFCKERVDWGSSWARAIVRLVESPLDQVKAAAVAGHLPLRLAVQAPGKVAVDEQMAWLGGALLQEPPPSRPRVPFREGDAEILTRARNLARACVGYDAPLAVLDAFIMRHWRQHVAGMALEEGRTPPPAPEPRELDFGWAGSTVAEALLGRWRPPEDLGDALSQLDAVQAVRRGRLSVLARGFARVHAEAYWKVAGYDCVWEYAERELGWSRRTAQRHHKLGRALWQFPQLDVAVREGFSPEAARDIGELAQTPDQCERLLELAWHLGPRDLKQALAKGGERLGDYERALRLALKYRDALLGPDGPTTRPSGVTEVFRIGEREAASSAGTATATEAGASSAGTPTAAEAGASSAGTAEAGASSAGTPARRRRVRLRISLVLPEPEGPDVVYAHPELLEAARWFVENNPLPHLSGFAARKEQVRYRCENPECWRVSLNNQNHHIRWCQHGGSNDLDNAVGLCRRCHLGGVHTKDERLRVTRVELERLRTRLWEYPVRAPVLQFLDLPPRPAPHHGGAA